MRTTLHAATLIRPTTLVIDNAGKYGHGYLEAQITCRGGLFDIELTDGYSSLAYKPSAVGSLKVAMCVAADLIRKLA